MGKEYAVPQVLSGQDIRDLRARLNISRADFASLAGVSVKTVQYWENGAKEITGPIVFMYRALSENPLLAESLEIPLQEYPLRLKYYYKSALCTLIDVDEARQLVKIRNYTEKLQYRAFGPAEHPDYAQFTEFLQSRCFPESRDKMKLELKRLGLPFYDPLAIIEKTGGRMAEDCFRLEVERKGFEEW